MVVKFRVLPNQVGAAQKILKNYSSLVRRVEMRDSRVRERVYNKGQMVPVTRIRETKLFGVLLRSRIRESRVDGFTGSLLSVVPLGWAISIDKWEKVISFIREDSITEEDGEDKG